MKKHLFYLSIIASLLFSCSKTKQGDLLEIPVDIDQNSSLPLSEITEEITAIELELTDKSVINTSHIERVIVSENNLIIADINKIFVFNKAGKFVHTIGSRGQGPGEYNYIQNLAVDEKNKRLFVVSSGPGKIICYDLNGTFLKEFSTHPILEFIVDINYINGDLLVIDQKMGGDDEMGRITSSALYRLNDDFRIIDSCFIRKNFDMAIVGFVYPDFILKGNTSINLYQSEFYIKGYAPKEIVLRDTLYRLEKNLLVPELRLRFRNDGIDAGGNKFIDPCNIYKSSRYVFSVYNNYLADDWNISRYYFCYDTKTGKGYNMKDGYTDDLNGIDERVKIRPLNTDPEMFYYLHTNMIPDDREEPNPTLYIGKLKK